MKSKEIVGLCRHCGLPVHRSKKFTLDCFWPMSFYHIKCFKAILTQNKVLTGIASTDTLE